LKLSAQQLPERPRSFVASELLHGDNVGFIINAYLAMQQQWPDEGGFAHYKYLLDTLPGLRPRVLRELAQSDTSRRLGSLLVDDLPPDFHYDSTQFDPQHSRAQYEVICQRLRLHQVVQEVRDTRELLSHLSLDGVSDAVETIVNTAMATLGLLDSRVNTLESDLQSLRGQLTSLAADTGREPGAPPPPRPGESAELTWLRHEVIRMSRRLSALESQADAPASPAAQG
jgi:hypothetical protein